MKALSLTQPWATLVAIGAKKIETRSWATKHRGQIAIHASKGFPKDAMCFARTDSFVKEALNPNWFDITDQLPLGAIIAVADIAHCLSTDGAYLNFQAANIEYSGGVLTKSEFSSVSYQKPLSGTPEYAFGDYSPNRYMWFLENVRQLEKPIPCKGALSLWEVPKEIETQILNI